MLNNIEKIARELAALNKLTALCIAKENLLSWGKSQEKMVEEMKSSTERIINWGYSYPNEDFLLMHQKRQPLELNLVINNSYLSKKTS